MGRVGWACYDARVDELQTPLRATVTRFDETDHVGRLELEGGDEIRFGASACEGFRPTVGATVYVTIIGPHPLGGRKAFKIRDSATSESEARRVEAAAAAAAADRAAREEAERRELAGPRTTTEAIIARVRSSVRPELGHEAEKERLNELVDDLRLVGPHIEHVGAILEGIVESHPEAHFGSPGPLVHYAETFYRRGLEDRLFAIAADRPRSHFVWMLGRIANDGDDRAKQIIRSYLDHPDASEPVRAFASRYLRDAP